MRCAADHWPQSCGSERGTAHRHISTAIHPKQRRSQPGKKARWLNKTLIQPAQSHVSVKTRCCREQVGVAALPQLLPLLLLVFAAVASAFAACPCTSLLPLLRRCCESLSPLLPLAAANLAPIVARRCCCRCPSLPPSLHVAAPRFSLLPPLLPSALPVAASMAATIFCRHCCHRFVSPFLQSPCCHHSSCHRSLTALPALPDTAAIATAKSKVAPMPQSPILLLPP